MAKDDLIGGALWDKYSDKVANRMDNPHNRGEITEEDAKALNGKLVVADYGAESCGDAVRLYWVVDSNDRIVAAKFKSFGCGTAIAASDVMTEMCLNKTVDEALNITNIDVERELRDDPDTPAVPPQKMHCSVMAYDAIKEAAAIHRGLRRDAFEDNDMVCECAQVRLQDIKDAIRINNLTTVEQITQYTKAGGFCKSCIRPGGHEQKKYYLVDILAETRQEMERATRENISDNPENLSFEALSSFQQGKRLEQYFNENIRPMLAGDGGGAEILDLRKENDHFIVRIRYEGACHGCASAGMGTKMAMEDMLQGDLSPLIDVEIAG